MRKRPLHIYPMPMRQALLLMLAAILSLPLGGCDIIKQDQVQVVHKNRQLYNVSSYSNVYSHNEAIPQKKNIEMNAEVLSRLKLDNLEKPLLPLAVSPDGKTVFAFEYTGNPVTDPINSRIITGNMLQEINLYIIKAESKSMKLLGRFMSLRDFRFNENGRLFAFIDGFSRVYIYDQDSEKLQKILTGADPSSYNTVSWSKDSKRLMLNNTSDFDISSGNFISEVSKSYTPFIKGKYNDNTYIVQMKDTDYNDMIAFYIFDPKSFMSITSGIYMDTDNINLIYTKDEMHGLNMVNLKTRESRTIENGAIYTAYIMKSTSDILYTTVNPDMDSRERYMLVKYNPTAKSKKFLPLTSPTFYVSPAEDKLYVVGDYRENSVTVDISTMDESSPAMRTDDPDLAGIKQTILKMYNLDYTFKGSFETYDEEAKKIYTNTYVPLPQEALANKEVDFKRFNTPLPAVQMDDFIPPVLKLYSLSISDDTASVNLGRYFINSIELVKQGGIWYITGFSTHPRSREVAEIRSVVQSHLNDIKLRNLGEALKYWPEKDKNDFIISQRKIVEELISNTSKYTIDIGEVELWSVSDPHRAENPEYASEAKVKIIIYDGTKIYKYKLLLSRKNRSSFTVTGWYTDPLSISQLY